MPRLLAGVPFVGVETLKARLDQGDDVLVLDVRSGGEFTGKGGHVPGSINLPLDHLPSRVAALKQDLTDHLDTPVFIVCQTSSRAAHAARLLRKTGFRDLAVVTGGMSSWRARGYPTRNATTDHPRTAP
nr:rhodanese-like domain-containing protein [Roseospira visakhapatnamensis]